ncbi:MAG TPA: hypothetical protein VMB50_16240 [Myxococcales bacterium]|nr:hypothetical protein [Myxococcales bacterium]
MIARSVGSLLCVACCLSLAPGARADHVDMTEAQFKLFHDYLDALKDPRVERMKSSKRLPAIARNFGVPVRKLEAAIHKGEELGGVQAIAKSCQDEVAQEVQGTPLEGRLGDVRVDASDSHVVTYVSWKADKPEALEQEASLLAVRVKRAVPITADIRLWATDPASADHKMFDAMITGEAAGRIQEARIADFAATRYIKLFEHVKMDRPAQ